MERRALEAAVRRALEGVRPDWSGETLVVGLSGGADSVALTAALARLRETLGFRLLAAHLDHSLRDTSPEDARFCADLCDRLGVELRTGSADVRARAGRDGRGLEDAGRRERYAFLRRVRAKAGAAALAVAHTRDDQAETLLLRLVRGAGRRGLSAMRPSRGRLVRPLLGVSRAEVLRYLAARGLGWREDASNADAAFRRNRVRHELLPLLEARFNPRVREGLARSAAVVADEAALLERLARRRAAGIVREGEGVVVVNRAALVRAPRALRRLVLRQALARAGGLRGVSAAHVERLLALAERKDSSGRRLPLPGRREARVVFGEIELGPARASSAPFAFALPLGVPGRVALPDGRTLVAEPAPGPGVSNEKAAVVALGAASLEVRTRRPGDRVRVRGRELSLKRFLADRRVEAGARQALPLVAAGSHVLFVPGLPVESPPGARYVKLSLEGPASR